MSDHRRPLTLQLVQHMVPQPPIPLGRLGKNQQEHCTTVSISTKRWATAFGQRDGWESIAGLYAFWWRVNDEIPLPVNNAKHWVKGKRRGKHDPKELHDSVEYRKIGDDKKEHLYYRAEWQFPKYDLFDGTYIPLYIGKANNIFSRVKQHLSWPQRCADHYAGAEPTFNPDEPIEKFTTFQQFSDGFHYLFRDRLDFAQRAKLDYVCLSLHKTPFHDFRTRFYLEDLLIGWFQPPFNMDSER